MKAFIKPLGKLHPTISENLISVLVFQQKTKCGQSDAEFAGNIFSSSPVFILFPLNRPPAQSAAFRISGAQPSTILSQSLS